MHDIPGWTFAHEVPAKQLVSPKAALTLSRQRQQTPLPQPAVTILAGERITRLERASVKVDGSFMVVVALDFWD